MAQPTDNDSEASKLAAALVHVEERRRWNRAGRVGAPPAQAAVAAKFARGIGKDRLSIGLSV